AVIEQIHAVSADAAVATARVTGTTADGGSVERGTVLVYHRVGAAFDRIESFAADRLDDALTAYRRLTAAASEPFNRCTEAKRVLFAAVMRRDWDAVRDMYAHRGGG